MATLLDAPKPPNPAKVEEYVEKQLNAARRRVRLLDYFMAGLSLAVVSLAFLVAVLLVDRYVETPRGTGWAVLAGYLALAAGFLYLTLFRPTRRQINPYFAARQVEQTVPNAKNSLVTWVDFEEDQRLPGSIKTAIGQKAARDLKGVDLNRAIENRKIIWLAIGAGLFLIANVVIAFLPPTRTELTLEEPKKGDITVFNNQEVSFQVRVHGRIPGANDADAVRLRLWYNPEDPEAYEERPMQVSDEDRRRFAVTIPAKQVRNGFQYKVLAGNSETPTYTVTCKIIPEFTGFEVTYQYPAYLKDEPQPNNDPNLLAPYGATATLIASTNREVKHGHIEIEGQTRTIDGQLIEGRPDAIQFTVPIEKEGFFRIWFTTPEGDKNQDPARLRLAVIDPKPVFKTFDLEYTYPAYLRFKPMKAADVREPEIEGPRGTTVILTAKTTRAVKDAKFEVPGQSPIVGEPVPDQPMWVRFKLPPIEQDATGQVSFTPTTAENPSAPRSISIRSLIDQKPIVELQEPKEDPKELPANGTLELKGLATDDHGVDKLVLKMKLLGAEDRDLVSKPYRGGMSFLRKEDNSWPTRVEYKDFVKLPDLRMEKNPAWRAGAGMEIEYWLEARDNRDIPPGPNVNISKIKRLKILAPKVPEQKKIDDRNKKLEQDQQAHQKKQDDRNQTEKRDVKQDPPKGAEKQPQEGDPQAGDKGTENRNADPGPQPRTADGNPEKRQNPDGAAPQDMNPEHGNQTEQVRNAIKNADRDNQAGHEKGGAPPPETKVDPSGAQPPPKADPTGTPPSETRGPPKPENMEPMGDGAAERRNGNVDKTTQEDKGSTKDKGDPTSGTPADGEDKRSYGGGSEIASGNKPDTKEPPAPKNGGTDTPQPKEDKGTARGNPTKKPDPKDPKPSETTSPGDTKPEKDTTTSETKRGAGEPGRNGDTPPADAAASKPRETPAPGEGREDKKSDQVTDNRSETRGGPTDGEPAGRDHKEKGKSDGSNTAEARNGPKGSTGTTSPKDGQKGNLDREPGQLAREINSPNPEVSDEAKEDVDRLMRNPKTREKTREELDKLERNAKDQLSRKKAQDLRSRGERAAKEYDQEKPTQEGVEKLAKKLGSKDERERQEAQQRAEDWEKDAQAKKDLENQVEQLKKKDPAAADRVKDAMDKSQQARAGNTGEKPQLDEKQMQDIAKDLNGADEKAKSDAQDKLQKLARDQKTAKEAQEKFQEMADKSPEGSKEKQDLTKAAEQAGKMAKEMAKKDTPPKGTPKLDPKDLEKAAKQLASADPKDREKAMEQLKDMMKDPKTREQAQEMLKDMEKNATTPEDKQAMENARKQAQELAKEMAKNDTPPKSGTPKVDRKDLEKTAKQLASGDPKDREKAMEQLKEMMKDPKTREQAQEMLKDMEKNSTTPEDKQAMENARKQAEQLAKEMGDKPEPKLNPEDLKNIAKQMNSKDEKAREQAKQKMQDLMNDPKAREKAREMMEQMANDSKNTPEETEALKNAMRQAAEMAKKDPPKDIDPKKLEELAKEFDKMDPKAKEELKKKFDEAMKDEKFREEMKKKADEMAKQPKSPEEQRQFNEMLKQLGGGFEEIKGTPDPADPRHKLKAAELLLEDFKKRIKDEDFHQHLKWTKEQEAQWIKDQEALIASLRKQAEKTDWRSDRERRSPVGAVPTQVKLEGKEGPEAKVGGRYTPPAGYVDPYNKFTKGQPSEPKR